MINRDYIQIKNWNYYNLIKILITNNHKNSKWKILKKLTQEQIKALPREELHELMKSRSEAEIEYDIENVPVLIDYINNFF